MKQVIQIEKKKIFWHIKKRNCSSFIQYLKNYFLLDTALLSINSFKDIQYVDIDENSFCMISYFFELIRIDKNKLYIRGFFPQRYNLLWCDVLEIRICIKNTAGVRQTITLYMKIR
jgi:hypothetical protein